jgi:hypothetical protein
MRRWLQFYWERGNPGMRMAYDTVLQSEVSAELAAQNSGFEPYRYECICCGEEVFIAAAHSTKVTAHFRHRSGNNDVECENYLGKYRETDTNSNFKKGNREKAEFYYDNISKTFCLAIKFDEDEIQDYEQQSIDLHLRTEGSDIPFYTLKINGLNFSPDVPTLIPLTDFSTSYYLSNTLDREERKYNFMNCDNAPIFLKILGNDYDFKAKLVRSNIIFTNTKYFVAFQGQYSLPQGVKSSKGVEIEQVFHFETMNRKFSGFIFSIKQHGIPFIDDLLKSWGYRLEASETLTLLWPPTYLIDDINVVASDHVFIFSSFELQARGNINVCSKEITKLSYGISKVRLKSKTKISKKNAEIVIDKAIPSIDDYDAITSSKNFTENFNVPSDGAYYLFNNSGVSPLVNGQNVFLTPNSFIIQYKSNYPVGYIFPCPQKGQTEKELLEDILKHYKRNEDFDSNKFHRFIPSEAISKYIERCKTAGTINSVVMQFIEEGIL